MMAVLSEKFLVVFWQDVTLSLGASSYRSIVITC
jgi:hypothetical protein